MGDMEDRSSQQPGQAPAGSDGLGLQIAIYTAMRVGLVVAVALLLTFVVRIPAIVSLLLAIIVQLPLSMILFNNQRRKVTDLIEARTSVRRAQRAQLRQALRGDEAP